LKASNGRKIWVDLDNSPHVLFFHPVVEELRNLGFQVFLTARDSYQVLALADRYGLEYRKVGHHYGKDKVVKIAGTFIRSFQLSVATWREKPDLAISHGSRSQLLAATALGIPAVMIYDYEFTNPLIFDPAWIMIPEIIPEHAVLYKNSRVVRYPGIKEDVYIPRFRPDPGIRTDLGIDDNDILVTVRPPATEAHYHNPESEELLKTAIEYLSGHPETRIVLLPRNARQKEFMVRAWRGLVAGRKLIIPERVVEGPNLIWHSDLVISGGGTMNREAAALNVPVYSIFRGRLGAVDSYLAGKGLLTLIERGGDIAGKIRIAKRDRESGGRGNDAVFRFVIDAIVRISEETARGKA
jgi:predicted glycosyltransferase